MGLITISLWIGMAAVGVVIAAFNLYDAVADLRWLEQQGSVNGRFPVARVAVLNEATGLLALLLLLTGGILVANVQYNPDPPPASLYVRGTILLTIAILVSHTITLRWLRHRLDRP